MKMHEIYIIKLEKNPLVSICLSLGVGVEFIYHTLDVVNDLRKKTRAATTVYTFILVIL